MVTVLFISAWFVSRWHGARVVLGSGVILSVYAGEFRAATMGPKTPMWSCGEVDPPRWDWDSFGMTWGGDFTYEVPLWAPLAVIATGALLMWWWDARRFRRTDGECAGCGYDRGGLAAEAVCPECGRAPA